MQQTSRHKCLLYEGHPSEQLPVIVPLLSDGLLERRRCLYLGDPDMIQTVETALGRAGVDVDCEKKRGALVFSSDRSHLDGRGFKPQAMVEMLRALVDEAVRDGFSGLCATGDMMWELGSEKNFDHLLEYEALLDQLFAEMPLQGICQYQRGIVPPRALRDALLTHPSLFVGSDLCADNLFYVPPELLIENPGTAIRDRQGDWMWQQISRIVTAEKERDQALEALNEANRDLERRVRERTSELESFSYSVSHDLRAPLRAIDGFSRSIQERDGSRMSSETRSDFDRVLHNTKRMGELIDALLKLSRLSRGEMHEEKVDLSEKSATALRSVQSNTERRVKITIAQGLVATGDAALLSIALDNLLSNAWKFTGGKDPAEIEVGKINKGGTVAFFVKDNGAGFDMKYADRLFGPFQRLHSQDEFPGVGVGLTTVQRIIHRHRGEIWVEAAPGKGATFYFTLPEPKSARAVMPA